MATPSTKEFIWIDSKIAAHVEAAVTAGFHVYAKPDMGLRSTSWVALCRDEAGPWAHIQKPTFIFEPVELDVPIQPSKEYGSGVKVDHDGRPEDAVRQLTKAVASWDVQVRFVPGARPIKRNDGINTLRLHGGIDAFTKLGERGTNWGARTLAMRLDVGDRFEYNGQAVEVQARRYGGPDYRTTIITPTGGPVIELRENEFVTLLGEP